MEALLLSTFRGTTEEVAEATEQISQILGNQEFIETIINFANNSSDDNLVISSCIQIKQVIQYKWSSNLSEHMKEFIFQWFMNYNFKSSQNIGILMEISELLTKELIFNEGKYDILEMIIQTNPPTTATLMILRSYFMLTKFITGNKDEEYIASLLDLVFNCYQSCSQLELSMIFDTLDFIHYRTNDPIFEEHIEGIATLLVHSINAIKETDLFSGFFCFVLSIHRIIPVEIREMIYNLALNIFQIEENMGIVEPAYLILEQFAQTNEGIEFFKQDSERFIEIMHNTYKITNIEEDTVEEDPNDFVSSNFVLTNYYPSKKIYMNCILDKLCNDQDFFQMILSTCLELIQSDGLSEQDLIATIGVLNAITNDIQNFDMELYQNIFDLMLELVDSENPFIRAASLGFISHANDDVEFDVDNLSLVLGHVEDDFSFVRFYAITAFSAMLSCIGDDFQLIENEMLEILDPLLDQFFAVSEILSVGQMTESIRRLVNVFNEHLVPRAEQFMLNLIQMFVQTPDALPYTKQLLYDLFADFVALVSTKDPESSETLLGIANTVVEITEDRLDDPMMVESLFDFAGLALMHMPTYLENVKELLPRLAEIDALTDFENTPRFFQTLRVLIAKMHATGEIDEELIWFCIEQSLPKIDFENDNSNSSMHLLGAVFLACKNSVDLSELISSVAAYENDEAYENNGYLYLIASIYIYNSELSLRVFEDRFWDYFCESVVELLPHIMHQCFHEIPVEILQRLIVMEINELSDNINDDDEGIFNNLTTLEYLNYENTIAKIREVVNLYINHFPEASKEFILDKSDLMEKLAAL